jgi:cell volume regulation protein A
MTAEPNATALLAALLGLLLGVSVLSSRASESTGVPAVLLFLGVGMLAGSDGILGVHFDDYALAFRLGTFALVMILFDAGLNTPISRVRAVWGPATALATGGVLITALLVGVGGRLLGLPWDIALLLGAIVSSTDSAATFSVLRGRGLALQGRVRATLEVESGVNDPLAVLLTLALTAALVPGHGAISWPAVVGNAALQLVVGAVVGGVAGLGGAAMLRRVRLQVTGLYPVMTMALGLLTFGLATLVQGSGFLAAYVAALVVGNAELPYRSSLARVHDAIAWLCQIGMFLVLGLLVYPTRLLEVAPLGLAVALILSLVARPVAVFLSLAPFRLPRRETAFLAWAGLRGAVPIILATFPVLQGVPGAARLFDLTFFVVVVSALLTAGTIPAVMRRLGLESDEPPAPTAVLEIVSTHPLSGALMSFYVDDALDITGVPLSELPFPDGTAVTLIVRNEAILVPKGQTTLEAGDHVYVATEPGDRAFVQLLFGRPEES